MEYGYFESFFGTFLIGFILIKITGIDKTIKKTIALRKELNNKRTQEHHPFMVTHTTDDCSINSCVRCGLPEDFINKEKVLCSPLRAKPCNIVVNPLGEGPNKYICKTHNCASPNAKWCIDAVIDEHTTPPKISD